MGYLGLGVKIPIKVGGTGLTRSPLPEHSLTMGIQGPGWASLPLYAWVLT